jgi:hypothetical protein
MRKSLSYSTKRERERETCNEGEGNPPSSFRFLRCMWTFFSGCSLHRKLPFNVLHFHGFHTLSLSPLSHTPTYKPKHTLLRTPIHTRIIYDRVHFKKQKRKKRRDNYKKVSKISALFKVVSELSSILISLISLRMSYI